MKISKSKVWVDPRLEATYRAVLDEKMVALRSSTRIMDNNPTMLIKIIGGENEEGK
jgi:hypothetical protein